MKRILAILSMSVISVCASAAPAQAEGQQSGQSMQSSQSGQSGQAGQTGGPVTGTVPLGVTVIQMEAVVRGWSAKRDLIDKTVVNDKNERIGKIEDLIITPNPEGKMPHASYAIIGAGGFLGIGRHDVVIPMEQLQVKDKQLMLPGATKDALKALPKFEYRKGSR